MVDTDAAGGFPCMDVAGLIVDQDGLWFRIRRLF